jgi:hypothetical protein
MPSEGRPPEIVAPRQRISLDLPAELVAALDKVAEEGRPAYLIDLLTRQSEVQRALHKTPPVGFYDLAGVEVSEGEREVRYIVADAGMASAPVVIIAHLAGNERHYAVTEAVWDEDAGRHVLRDEETPALSLREIERVLARGWPGVDCSRWVPFGG